MADTMMKAGKRLDARLRFVSNQCSVTKCITRPRIVIMNHSPASCAAEQRLERKPDGQSIDDTVGISHHSEASIDARTSAIMAEAERQLAKEQRDENNDIPRHSQAAKVQVL